MLASDVEAEIRSQLDAEGSDHYRFDRDIAPAINSSVRWILSVLQKAVSTKKFSMESLHKLQRTEVFVASTFSRISFDPTVIGRDVWGILSVNPKPVVHPLSAVPPVGTADESIRTELSYISSKFSAARKTYEVWEEQVSANPFQPGYSGDAICNGMKSYAYLDIANYNVGGAYGAITEIEISPPVPREFVGVRYFIAPAPIETGADEIELPDSLFTLLVSKALQFIAFKQGDKTNLFSVATNDVNILLQAIG